MGRGVGQQGEGLGMARRGWAMLLSWVAGWVARQWSDLPTLLLAPRAC